MIYTYNKVNIIYFIILYSLLLIINLVFVFNKDFFLNINSILLLL